jgi:hypothetical protein
LAENIDNEVMTIHNEFAPRLVLGGGIGETRSTIAIRRERPVWASSDGFAEDRFGSRAEFQ